MVPYYAHHYLKQYIRGKPIRFGYKVWSANTPLGYCIQLEPYQRTGVTHNQLGLGGSVVVNLVSTLPTDNYVLFFYNFFTGLKLLQHLTTINIHASGTVCANRVENCPITSVDRFKKLARGSEEHRLDAQSNIIVARWNAIVLSRWHQTVMAWSPSDRSNAGLRLKAQSSMYHSHT
jgi:DNA excision repair protein ERCC-6